MINFSKSLHYSFLTFFIILTFTSCKKKEAEVPIDPNTGCTNCTPSVATTFSGLFKAGTYTVYTPMVGSTVTERANVFFSSQPTNVTSIANSVTVNAVYFNDDTLTFTAAPYYYTNLSPVNLSSQTWSVNGAGNIPSFTFKNLKEKPSYTSISALPDTVRKSIGFNFIITDLINSTAASVYISDGLAAPGVVTKIIDLGTDTAYFTPTDLNAVINSTTAVITLFMENSFGVKVDGKDFKMSKEASWTKKVVIKN